MEISLDEKYLICGTTSGILFVYKIKIKKSSLKLLAKNRAIF